MSGKSKAEEVRELFPEIGDIQDKNLQEKVTRAWVTAWEDGEYDDIRDVPGLPMIEGTNNVEHTRLVTNIAKSLAETINTYRDEQVNVDYCIAGALCHDLGKVYEYVEVDEGEWINGTWETSRPTIRHPVYSVHIALNEDFPLEVVHAIGSHSREGDHVKKSAEGQVVSLADTMYWRTKLPERY